MINGSSPGRDPASLRRVHMRVLIPSLNVMMVPLFGPEAHGVSPTRKRKCGNRTHLLKGALDRPKLPTTGGERARSYAR
jgi:hypothetical protein